MGALVTLILLYAAAGLIGGAIPAGRGAPAGQITIFVADNGVHTGIVVPVAAVGVDWRQRVPADAIRDARYAEHRWMVFGWGDRAFYLETPSWAEARPGRILRAAIGSDATVIHAEYVGRPPTGPQLRAVRISAAGYRRLAQFIDATFAAGPPVPGYGVNDAFFPARGRYSAIRTCNAWTGEALRAAGVRMGMWTPFPATVMWWL